jgi:hypothetical protein
VVEYEDAHVYVFSGYVYIDIDVYIYLLSPYPYPLCLLLSSFISNIFHHTHISFPNSIRLSSYHGTRIHPKSLHSCDTHYISHFHHNSFNVPESFHIHFIPLTIVDIDVVPPHNSNLHRRDILELGHSNPYFHLHFHTHNHADAYTHTYAYAYTLHDFQNKRVKQRGVKCIE